LHSPRRRRRGVFGLSPSANDFLEDKTIKKRSKSGQHFVKVSVGCTIMALGQTHAREEMRVMASSGGKANGQEAGFLGGAAVD
jgi:hypothetical protein